VTGAVTGAVDAVKRFLRIGSPSKLFAQYGRWTAEGFIDGVDAMAAPLKESVSGAFDFGRNLVSVPTPQMTAPVIPDVTANGFQSSTSAIQPPGDVEVKVYIGDKQLTDIIDRQVVRYDRGSSRVIFAGRVA
jgi:hypothetical protein